MNQIRAIILDFDGVLAESNAVKDSAFDDFFALYPEHYDEMRAYHLQNHARPRRDKFKYYVENLLMGAENSQDVDQMAETFSSLVAERVINCPEVPGSTAFLQEFSGAVPLYISSVTPQDELIHIVTRRGIISYFKGVFGDPPNTKRDVVKLILQREGLEPYQVAFVGDSNSDYEVATKAHLVFFARDSGQLFAESSLDLSIDLYQIAEKLRPLVATN